MGDKISLKDVIHFYAEGRRNFRNADFSGLEFKRINLQEADLQGAYIRWGELQGANLKGANLSWADLQKANLSDAVLHKANLKEANLKGACLQWADLSEANLQGATVIKGNLSFANLRDACLRLAKFQDANLDKANLNGVDLRVAMLLDADLSDADIQRGKLQEANLTRANLTGANLEGANLQGATLEQANLMGANLTRANFNLASLQRANLTDAKLFGCNFDGANLTDAKLPAIENMLGVSFKGANLKGARLPNGDPLQQVLLPNGSLPDPRQLAAIAPTSPVEPRTNQTKQDLLEIANGYSTTPRLSLSEGPVGGSPAGWVSPEARRSPLKSPEAEFSATPDPLPLLIPPLLPENGKGLHSASLGIVSQPKEGIPRAKHQYLYSASIAISHRRGPGEFRQNLLAAYHGCCAVTGCNAEPVLEAVYLKSNDRNFSIHPSSGLLLRSDVHTLFDLHLLAIEPQSLTVLFSPELRETCYAEYHGKLLREAIAPEFQPDPLKLQFHWNLCQWIQDL
ncbi:pentapeptide repeat-containing protein [Oscillatoria acuminata]|uniref:Putative low-complexity protein n=1 Tax=Oscillatoria acuminata PCC 6304 TaxID=56110 RepID=K9TC55_9CYAN|nr:pentapeptide repeat-containing protein [Oscillatoria acuminata]AFY80120.1 putative low-complexity protein [Oscillatoria acuminata PCC 6304]